MDVQKRIVTGANWDSGRGGHAVTGVVLHTMVGYIQPSEDLFNDPSHGVSVHYGIGEDGGIRQWVEEADTAWQAGNYAVNQTTIGIEHEDRGNAGDAIRTDALYESSASLVADICRRYGFPADASHILLHKNVIDTSRYPGGTACPDGLDSARIISTAARKLQEGEGSVLNEELVNRLFVTYLGRPGQAQDASWIGKPTNDLVITLEASQERKNYVQNIAGQLAQLPALQKQVADLQSQLNALKAQQANAAEANLLGQALIKLLTAFGYKKG